MSLHRETRGAAIVELAIVLPVLVLLLVGILEFGRAYNAYATVQSASAEGAHWAALHPNATVDDIKTDAVLRRIVPLRGDQVTVKAWYFDSASAGYVEWEGGIPEALEGTYVPIRVEVSYPWSAVTFLIGSLIPNRPAWITATATADALR